MRWRPWRPPSAPEPPSRTAVAAMRELGVGVVGYGVMGKAHSYGYTAAPEMRALPVTPRLRIISGRDVAAVERAAAAYGFQAWTGDWRAVVERPGVDPGDRCTPPATPAA